MSVPRPDSPGAPLDPASVERLNAYLDGELPADDRNRLEHELAEDPRL